MQFRPTVEVEALIICIQECVHSLMENQVVCPLELENVTTTACRQGYTR